MSKRDEASKALHVLANRFEWAARADGENRRGPVTSELNEFVDCMIAACAESSAAPICEHVETVKIWSEILGASRPSPSDFASICFGPDRWDSVHWCKRCGSIILVRGTSKAIAKPEGIFGKE